MARKKLSKKGKKNQRKNTDISDLEAVLEKQRNDALRGGAVESRKNESLFFEDKGKNKKVLGSRKDHFRSKMLTTEKLLLPNPHVKAAPSVKSKAWKGFSVQEDKKVAKLENALLERAMLEKKDKKETTPALYDLWGDDDAKEEEEESEEEESESDEDKMDEESEGEEDKTILDFEENDYLDVVRKKAAMPRAPPRVAPSKLPAVDIPAPGASYRPTYDAHQDELGEAVAQVLAKQAKEKIWNKRQRLMKKPKTINEESEVQQLEEEREEDTPFEMPEHVNLPNVDKKTRTVINKQRKKRKAEHELEEEQTSKKQHQDIDNMSALLEEIQDEEVARQEKQLAKERLEKDHELDPKKIGKHKLDEGIKQVVLTEDLPKQLRHLKPIGNPIKDRFVNLQKRNLIEVRGAVGRKARKGKLKQYEKKNMDVV